jgi:hypothetical protein
MVRGARYTRTNRGRKQSSLGWQIITLVERFLSRETQVIEGKSATTYYDYDWIVWADGEPLIISEGELNEEIVSGFYDFGGVSDA